YSEYNYMDNCLRGGYPVRLGNNKIFYVYSRKHGDIERDYNYFTLLPEFYSQGNGSFRDINQNRRCDSFFAPFTGTENIREFYNLIQLDGYNPLGIEKLTYSLNADKADSLLPAVPEEYRAEVKALVTKEYTPGSLFMLLSRVCAPEDVEDTFTGIIDFSESLINGNFGEGYWCDHWTYNLDLVEDYLSVFPDKEKELLFDTDFTYFKSEARILPRIERYVKTEKGIRQYYCVREDLKSDGDKMLRKDHGRGDYHRVSLMEKLILLSVIKFATLDPHGMGIEMEGGKPGWYDALNGLPALFGSSVGETCELARNLLFTMDMLKKHKGSVNLTKEVCVLLQEVSAGAAGEADATARWNKMNDLKEKYREETYKGISGETVTADSEEILKALSVLYGLVMQGIEKALKYGDGICPMYFSYEVTDYKETDAGIVPLEFKTVKLPAFLEGTVRYLKLPESVERKRAICNEVRESGLYDKKLSMYKVNASLKDASYELGRCTAFTPGWLENESIWLHMEYKYLLELIKSGLYPEFIRDFKNAAIPFLDEETYGRSTMENSSFIASSANPDERIHGKGFVARLSGTTVEFMSIWKLMFFGSKPFTYENGSLNLSFAPTIPSYLLNEERKVTVMFLGSTPVTYEFDETADYIPGNYHVEGITLTYKNGTVVNLTGGKITGPAAEDVRCSRVSGLKVSILKK
ncbi:MAG: hypothetical protein ILP13_09195, partial [Lachnospiraceae bacterium]|nr:hypothetical protein [Lachnospiraceae bacterium]